MLVSTCRIDLQPDVRRGYTLHLTNLEDVPLEYLVTFVVTAQVGLMGGIAPAASQVAQFARFTGEGFFVEQPFRRLLPGVSVPFNPAATYTADVRLGVGPKQTRAIGIAPPQSLGFGALFARAVINRLEGYVTLRLPPARSQTRRFFTQPQLDRPARVLINPETRTINVAVGQRMDIYDDPPPVQNPLAGLFGGVETYDPPPVKSGFTQLASRTTERTEPLHLASGQAENELEPEGSRLITAAGLEYAIAALGRNDVVDAVDYRGAELVADQDRAGALIELLCELGSDVALAEAVNQVLEQQEAAPRIVIRQA